LLPQRVSQDFVTTNRNVQNASCRQKQADNFQKEQLGNFMRTTKPNTSLLH